MNPADGLSYLAMPQRFQEPFDDFLDHVVAQERHQEEGNVRYAQTRMFLRYTSHLLEIRLKGDKKRMII